MKNRFMASILFTMALVFASLVYAGSVLAEESCPPADECSVFAKKDTFTLAIMPDEDGQWPVVVTEAGGYFDCGDEENYPCLAWEYKCVGADCNNIANTMPRIPVCCDIPIETLWTSIGPPEGKISKCDEDGSLNSCTAYEIAFPPTSGPEGQLFWFTTPLNVNIDIIDVLFKVGVETLPCVSGIKGPSCPTLIEPVRVEPRKQCYQFVAENQPSTCTNPDQLSTWLAEWDGGDPCAVKVWAAYGDEWNCENVRIDDNEQDGEELSIISKDGTNKTLSETRVTNAVCDEMWFRFTDDDLCNARCYVSGGRLYCIR